MLKRRLAKQNLKTKDDLEKAIKHFWSTVLTVERCNKYIDHLYKVIPTVILIGGHATADLPRKIFPERSRGKSIKHFNEQLEVRQFCQKILFKKNHNVVYY
jgi:hypothetical protein